MSSKLPLKEALERLGKNENLFEKVVNGDEYEDVEVGGEAYAYTA